MRMATAYERYLYRMQDYYKIKNMEQPEWIEKARRYYLSLYDSARTFSEMCSNTAIPKATMEYLASLEKQSFEDLPVELRNGSIDINSVLSSVFFIGRYSFDEKLLSDSGVLDCRYNNAEKFNEIIYRKRPDLRIAFVTAHKSKGLQADYIFIINNKKSRMGFPSQIQDSPILSLLLENYEQYPYAEERRLYYVSLTRAKKKAYIVTVQGKESEFAMELKKQYGEEIKREQFTCPECGGSLIKRTSQYGDFFGCSNYSTRGCKYTRKIMSRGAARSQNQVQR